MLLAVLSQLKVRGQNADEKAILKILDNQILCWNKGDLDNFVKGYWKNDSLMFIGSNGVVYGYRDLLDRYKKTTAILQRWAGSASRSCICKSFQRNTIMS